MKFLDKLFGREASQVQVMQAQVAVSDMFKTWVQSDIGRYIIGRAEQYEVQVLRELSGTDPKDTIGIIRLQSESQVPGKLMQWIEDAIQEGEVSRFQLAEIEE